jgi:hypothetical protein
MDRRWLFDSLIGRNLSAHLTINSSLLKTREAKDNKTGQAMWMVMETKDKAGPHQIIKLNGRILQIWKQGPRTIKQAMALNDDENKGVAKVEPAGRRYSQVNLHQRVFMVPMGLPTGNNIQ